MSIDALKQGNMGKIVKQLSKLDNTGETFSSFISSLNATTFTFKLNGTITTIKFYGYLPG